MWAPRKAIPIMAFLAHITTRVTQRGHKVAAIIIHQGWRIQLLVATFNQINKISKFKMQPRITAIEVLLITLAFMATVNNQVTIK